MTRTWKIIAGTAAVVALFVLAIVLAVWVSDDGNPQQLGGAQPLGLNIQTYTGTYDADSQYLGRCEVVTPPSADRCDSASGLLRYVFWDAVVNANQFKTWRNQNPGEYARLTAHMQTPGCPSGQGLPQDMLTYYGAYLYIVTQAYACVVSINGGAVSPIAWPVPNVALDPNRSDKTPPTAPGPITVGP